MSPRKDGPQSQMRLHSLKEIRLILNSRTTTVDAGTLVLKILDTLLLFTHECPPPKLDIDQHDTWLTCARAYGYTVTTTATVDEDGNENEIAHTRIWAVDSSTFADRHNVSCTHIFPASHGARLMKVLFGPSTDSKADTMHHAKNLLPFRDTAIAEQFKGYGVIVVRADDKYRVVYIDPELVPEVTGPSGTMLSFNTPFRPCKDLLLFHAMLALAKYDVPVHVKTGDPEGIWTRMGFRSLIRRWAMQGQQCPKEQRLLVRVRGVGFGLPEKKCRELMLKLGNKDGDGLARAIQQVGAEDWDEDGGKYEYIGPE